MAETIESGQGVDDTGYLPYITDAGTGTVID